MPFDPSLSTCFHCICFNFFMFNEETESCLSYGYKKAPTIYIHSLLVMNDLVLDTTYWCTWELRSCDNEIDRVFSEWDISREQRNNSLLDCHTLRIQAGDSNEEQKKESSFTSLSTPDWPSKVSWVLEIKNDFSYTNLVTEM